MAEILAEVDRIDEEGHHGTDLDTIHSDVSDALCNFEDEAGDSEEAAREWARHVAAHAFRLLRFVACPLTPGDRTALAVEARGGGDPLAAVDADEGARVLAGRMGGAR